MIVCSNSFSGDFKISSDLNFLLNQPASDLDLRQKAIQLGFPPEQISNGTLFVIALFQAAIAGNSSAMKELQTLISQSAPNQNSVVIIQ